MPFSCLKHVIILIWLLISAVSHSLASNPEQTDTITSHAIAMHGAPKYPANFKLFEYTSPHATYGGTLKLGAQGNFDSLNPFIAKGTSEQYLSLSYDTLLVQAKDEAFTEYGLVAETMEYPADRSFIIFKLRKQARFHDGVAITADDIVSTFNLLMEKGNPFYHSYYSGVESVIALSKHKVRFNFKPGTNHELALIVGQLPILPKHYWQNKDFANTTTEIPIGSGPYKIKSFQFGRSISYERDDNYWAKDLNVNAGMYNFNTIQVDYYKDAVVLLEALKAKQYDFRLENSSKQWATGYNSRALNNGQLIKEQIPHQLPTGMQAFLFNLRNPLFTDMRVRQAINLAFNFEWSNKNLFYDAYTRTESYFSNSELASSGLPSENELKILNKYRDDLPASIFNEIYKAPVSGGDKYNRTNLLAAQELLKNAGWVIKNNELVNNKNQTLNFEILLVQPSFERIVNPFVKSLAKLGIKASIRHVEVSQYINRLRHFEFDMIVGGMGQSLSPGNEQIDYWHSSKANTTASRNYIGINNPVIDELIELLISSPDRESLITNTRILDRVLLHHHYVIPQFHISSHRIAYWDKFSKPSVAPKYDSRYQTGLMTWWMKTDN